MRMDKSSFNNNIGLIGPDAVGIFLVLAYHLIYGSIPEGWWVVLILLVGAEANNWQGRYRFNSVLKEDHKLSRINFTYSLIEPGYFVAAVFFIMNTEELQNIILISIVFLPFVISRTIALANAPLFEVGDEDEESVDLQLYPLTLRRMLSLKPLFYQLTFRSRSIKYMSPVYYQLINIGLIVFYIVAMINPGIGYHFSYVDVVVTLMIVISFYFNVKRQASLLSSAKLKEESGMSS